MSTYTTQTKYSKKDDLAEQYEQIRNRALSNGVPKMKNKSMGLLVQKGLAAWIKIVRDFCPISRPIVNHPPEVVIVSNSAHEDLTSLLTEVTLKHLKMETQL